jgi:hypothetical protein
MQTVRDGNWVEMDWILANIFPKKDSSRELPLKHLILNMNILTKNQDDIKN